MPALDRDRIARRLRRYYLSLKRYVTDVPKFVHGNIREIEAGAQVGGLIKYPSAFAARSNWLTAKGVVEIMEGHEKGLDLLYQAVYYDEACVRCLWNLYRAYSKYPTPNIEFNMAALLLARAVTLGCWDEADQVADTIRHGLAERRKVGGRRQLICAFDAMHMSRAAPFVLNLYAQWSGHPFLMDGLPIISMNEYEPLLSLWQTQDMAALTEALLKACDLHMERSKLSEVKDYEFNSEAAILHPAEILAVLRLRETKGLANPVLDHPLMQTPVGRLFEIRSVPHEEMLDRAAANFLATIPPPAPPE